MPTERADILIAGHATLSTPGDDDALAGAIFAPARRALPVWEDVLERPVRYGAVDDARLPAPEELLAAVPGLRSEEAAARGNRLAEAVARRIEPVVEAAKEKFGASRVGILIGTSVAGMSETEAAFLAGPVEHADDRLLEIANPVRYLRRRFRLTGPGAAVSTACTSSAKAMASAARWIRAGICDAVVTGGIDAASRFTVKGFDALGVLSKGLAQPFAATRDGINLGEAAAVFVLTHDRALTEAHTPEGDPMIRLAGWAETSDAHHISSPDPEGLAVEAAIRRALAMAGADTVDYVNAHGTGTPANDAMEAAVYARCFPGVPVSSTKPVTGHTLGAAGALEAAVAVEVLRRGLAPANLSDLPADPAYAAAGLRIVEGAPLPGDYHRVLSASFAFGGSNAVLILEKTS